MRYLRRVNAVRVRIAALVSLFDAGWFALRHNSSFLGRGVLPRNTAVGPLRSPDRS